MVQVGTGTYLSDKPVNQELLLEPCGREDVRVLVDCSGSFGSAL